MVKKASEAIPNRSLRAAREARGWTQKEVAASIGAPSPLNVTRWERGTTLPSALYKERLCRLFGTSQQALGFRQSNESSQNEYVPESGLSSPLWMVPYRRNLFFTGREELLSVLAETFTNKQRAALTQAYALSGLGGIGKTQLALEYAYRHRNEYRAIFWLRAASYDTLLADVSAIAELLKLPERQEPHQRYVLPAVKQWLNQQNGWLLIRDNVDDLALLADFLPETGLGHVLITTRLAATGTLAISLPVEEMSMEEGTLFLLKRARLLPAGAELADVQEETRGQAFLLVQMFDGLPLALNQAGAYLEESGCSIATYLELYRSCQHMLLKRQGNTPMTYPPWSLAFRERLLGLDHPETAAAYFDLDWLYYLQGKYQQAEEAAGRALAIWERKLGYESEETLDVLGDLGMIYIMRGKYELAKEVLQRALTSYERCFGSEYPALSDPLNQLGLLHLKTGDLERAEQYFRRALNVDKKAYPVEHHSTFVVVSNLGMVYEQRGDLQQAEEHYLRALARFEHDLGSEHPETLTISGRLAWLLHLQGKEKEAERLFQQVIAAREAITGHEHPHLAQLLYRLACIYEQQKRFEEAEPLLQRALLVQEEALGAQHPETLVTHQKYRVLRMHKEKAYSVAPGTPLLALTTRETDCPAPAGTGANQ